MANDNMPNTYKSQQIMTASPEELTLLLYNGAIRFISESIVSMEQGNIEQSHNSNLRAQGIVREFMITLDMKYEISKIWLPVYEYILYCLLQSNIKKDKEQLLQVKLLLSELRDAWVVAMRSMYPKQVLNPMVGSNTAKELWLNYRILTKEMVKFLEKQEMDLFYEFMNQRKRLQEMINYTEDDDFKNSDEGRGLLFEIQSDSQFISHTLQCQFNIQNRQHQVSTAYDSQMGNPISRMSWKR